MVFLDGVGAPARWGGAFPNLSVGTPGAVRSDYQLHRPYCDSYRSCSSSVKGVEISGRVAEVGIARVGPLHRLGRKHLQVWRPADACPGSQIRVGGEEDKAEAVEKVFAQTRDAEELLLVNVQELTEVEPRGRRTAGRFFSVTSAVGEGYPGPDDLASSVGTKIENS